MATINSHTTRATGTVLTAAIYNADHVNHVNNANALNVGKAELPIATAGIDDDAVTFAKIQNIATSRVLGRITASSGNVEELTGANLKTIMGLDGATTANKLARYTDTTGGTGETGISEDGSGNLSGLGFMDIGEISTPADPAANIARLYSKDDAGTTKLYFRDSAGLETPVGGAAGPTAGMILLTSGVISSAVASLDIVLTAYTAYRAIRFYLTSFIPATTAVEFWARFSTNGGSSFDAGASDYAWSHSAVDFTGAVIAGFDVADNEIAMTGAVVSSATSRGASAIIDLFDQTNAAVLTRIISDVSVTLSTDTRRYAGSGSRLTAQDTDAIQFRFSSGNIASGKYAVYGMA